jgi:hypothetical protein
MTCDEFFTKLIEGGKKVDPAIMKELEEHAKGCPECKELLADYTVSRKVIDALPPVPDPPPRHAERVRRAAQAFVEADHGTERRRRWGSVQYLVAASLSALIGVGGFGGGMYVQGVSDVARFNDFQNHILQKDKEQLDRAIAANDHAGAEVALSSLKELEESGSGPVTLGARIEVANGLVALGGRDPEAIAEARATLFDPHATPAQKRRAQEILDHVKPGH